MDVVDPPQGFAPYIPRLLVERADAAKPGTWEVEGTLVFADISGFTRLSEKLARRGKVGAEQLVLTLCDLFTSLLTASDDGGDVLKFGGDALLILYTGDDHALRAVHAAHEMQRTLARVGRLSTASGPVRLRMSVGVASGTYQLVLVGDEHLELVIVGPDATETVTMESAADATEVLVSHTTARLLPARSLGAAKEPGVLLARPPDLAPKGTAPLADRAGLAPYIPIALRDRLGIHAGEAHEHRLATVAFAHVGGVDDLLVTDGPDVVFDRLLTAGCIIEEATTRYGVTIVCTDIASDGAKWMLCTGAPDAGEDDELRLMLAAREMVDRIDVLPARVGINRGRVFGGDVGAPFRRTWSVMGDPVNLAARIMGKTPWGTVWAHDDVVSQARERVVSEAVPAFMVKGKRLAVTASEVLGAVRQRSGRSSRLPLVGRDAELATLLAAADAALQGRGGVVEVVGPLGIGKTRLVDELIALRPEIPSLELQADVNDRGEPFGLLRQLLLPLLSVTEDASTDEVEAALTAAVATRAPELAPVLSLLGAAFGLSLPVSDEVAAIDARFRQQRLNDAVASLVVALAPPVAMLVVDDVRRADDASVSALEVIARRAADGGWLIVFTHREGQEPLVADATVVELEPLGDADALALVREAESVVGGAGETDELLSTAGGNPLFLVELAGAPRRPGAALPSTIEVLVASRIDALAPADRRLLRMTAAVGLRAPVSVLEAAWGSPVEAATLGRLDGFVALEGGEVVFRLPVYRDVAYEGLPFTRRREVHAAIAQVIASDPATPASDLSLHWSAAERWAEAWPAARLAADEAKAAYAVAEASVHLRRALVAGGQLGTVEPEVLVDLAEELGGALERIGRFDEADAAFREGRVRSTDDVRKLLLQVRSARVTEAAGKMPVAVRTVQGALRSADPLPSPGREQVLARGGALLTGLRIRQGRLKDAVEAARPALDAAQSAGDHASEARLWFLLDAALTDLGDPAAMEVRDRALPIFETLGDLVGQADTLNNLGINAYYEGRWGEALRHYEASRVLRERAGDTTGAATARMNAGEILADLGDLDGAASEFESALRVFRTAGYAIGEGVALSNLGRTRQRSGRIAEAHELLELAETRFSALGADAFVAEVRGRVAEALLAEGRTVEAWDVSIAALELAEGSGNPAVSALLHLVRGRALLAANGAARARIELDQALDLARRLGAPLETAGALLALADADGAGPDDPRRVEAAELLAALTDDAASPG